MESIYKDLIAAASRWEHIAVELQSDLYKCLELRTEVEAKVTKLQEENEALKERIRSMEGL